MGADTFALSPARFLDIFHKCRVRFAGRGRNMDFSQLKSFYLIATLGNFHSAAEAVHRTTSAVSYQIKALEESLDVQLFERLPKHGAVLTPFGRRLLEFAENVFHMQDVLMEDLEDIRLNRSGSLRVSLPPTILHAFFPEIICRFRQRYPNIGVQVLERLPSEAVSMLQKGTTDFCVSTEANFPSHVRAHPWRRSIYYLAVRQGHPLLDGPLPPPLEDVAKFPLIMPAANSRYAARRRMEQVFDEKNLSYTLSLESNNVLASLEYVRRGDDMCFMSIPEGFPCVYPEELRFLPMDAIFPPENLCILTREGVGMTAPVAAFLETILETSVPSDETNGE